MKKMIELSKPWRQGLVAAALFALLLGAVVASPAAAHTEGTMQVASADAGPFKLTVWTSPDPAEVGEIHVAAAVVTAEEAAPVLDAQVVVQMMRADGGDPMLVGTASTEDSENKFLYEAVLTPDRAGLYTVVVEVTGADGATGSTQFELEVAGSGFNWLLVIVPLGLAVAGVGAFWMWRRN
ncbi:MAG: hypothetical protein R3300_05610 [Candidatus Promineifilaceae bacterium]|nr:hypothetical protein [Candidatus Promineifilaceae bacterium]